MDHRVRQNNPTGYSRIREWRNEERKIEHPYRVWHCSRWNLFMRELCDPTWFPMVMRSLSRMWPCFVYAEKLAGSTPRHQLHPNALIHVLTPVYTPCYTLHNMATKNTRTVVFLPAQMRKALERLSDKTGAPLGELIRRALTMYLKREKA
jgi:hypothetical protein